MMNDIAFLLGTSLMYGTPLLYAALGGVISENSGVVNIGLEGIMTMGAFIGAWLGYVVGNPWLAFVGAGVAGALLGLLHALACITLKSNQVVTGTAINFIGPGLAIFLSRKLFDGAAMTINLDMAQKMPKPLLGLFKSNSFFEILLNQDASVFLSLLLVLAMWFLLYRTRTGLRIRACGEHPKAAATLGIKVNRVRYASVIASGALAGLGGATMSLAVASNFFPALISGHGFIALAAMIFGRWKPQGALGACIVFGFSKALVVLLSSKQVPISADILSILPYVVTLLILMFTAKKSAAPAADGLPYDAVQ